MKLIIKFLYANNKKNWRNMKNSNKKKLISVPQNVKSFAS